LPEIVNIFPAGVPMFSTKSFKIYPNPTTGELIIKQGGNDFKSFAITNSLGQLMLQQQLDATKMELNIASLPRGLYFITLKGDSGYDVQKFIKL
jgi:hypothetical protein